MVPELFLLRLVPPLLAVLAVLVDDPDLFLDL